MISNPTPVVSETSKVGLRPLLLLNSYSHDFDLIVGEADLDLELVGHDELVSFDGVVVVLLLLRHLVAFLLHHLLLHIPLIEFLSETKTRF